MNRILVTGRFGFLGSYLVERLIKDESNHVHAIDDLSVIPLIESDGGAPSAIST